MTTMPVSRSIALLHPGQMGASIGAALRQAGHEVGWAAEGRSDDTRRRAAAAGLTERATVADLVAQAEVVLSICPPGAALAVAAEVAALGFGGTYVDANAVAPATAMEVARIVEAGATFVDGDLIGGPVRPGGATRLYLSGPAAGAVAGLFAQPDDPQVVVLGDGPAAASALKMCYAAWTKGTSALLLAIDAAARSGGVRDALIAEWERTQPDVPVRLEAAVIGTPTKAWRFAGEMEEIAATFATVGLPDGFALAAAEVYRRLASFKDGPAPDGSAVAHAVAHRPTGGDRRETPA
jgi:3-hydroxyisobutyrate dehydrogenase-like beta-hydroxyacid dehydrogenase